MYTPKCMLEFVYGSMCVSCDVYTMTGSGDSKPGSSVELERVVQGHEGAGTLLKYNPHLNLSVAQQRQRLPIFQVRAPIHSCMVCIVSNRAIES